MKSKIMLLCLVFFLVSFMAINGLCAPSLSDNLRYIPTIITFTKSYVRVDGYFVNLNDDCTISKLKDFEMSIYEEDELLFNGYFGEINVSTIGPLKAVPCSFRFEDESGYKSSIFTCGANIYADFSCRFSYR